MSARKATADEITCRLQATGIPFTSVRRNRRLNAYLVLIRGGKPDGDVEPTEPKEVWAQRLSAAHLKVIKIDSLIAEWRPDKPTLIVEAQVELGEKPVEITTQQTLIAQAEALAAAKREADAAAERYKALEAAFTARPEVAEALDAKKTTKQQLDSLDTQTRALLEQQYRETGSTDVGTPYYELTTTTDLQMTDAEQRTLVDWLVRNMPALAVNLLALDMRALEKMIHQNTVKSVDDDGVVTYGLPQWFAGMPVVLRPRIKTQINWSKLPKVEAVKVVEQAVAREESEEQALPQDMDDIPF